ncbi:MAG: hypothetical protein SGI98_02770 [Verrucomicrobiota bacterium]|nr:hypothetical protein [Verrucomicrobiota bacterium]
MKLETIEYPFTVLTPCFCGGAESKTAKTAKAEMRSASVRGMIRFWHRHIAKVDYVNEIWGSASGGEGNASRVKLTVQFDLSKLETSSADILPHKKSGPRSAMSPNQGFNLILTRMPNCAKPHWDEAQKAVKLWLILGCLGLRSNRAAGSVWPIGDWVPHDKSSLQIFLKESCYKEPCAMADASLGSRACDLREAASDTLGGHETIFGGIKPSRQSSPIKFKVISLAGEPRLLITAPGKDSMFLEKARSVLAEGRKNLGKVKWQDII